MPTRCATCPFGHGRGVFARDVAVAQRQPLRAFAERGEDGGVGAGHEGLAAEVVEDAEEGPAARLVEMGGDLVEENDRRLAGEPRHEPRLREDEADEERLLLAGRAALRRHLLRAVADEEIGEMRPEEGASGSGVARALGAKERAIAVLDLAGGVGVEVALERPFERDLGGGERRLRRRST